MPVMRHAASALAIAILLGQSAAQAAAPPGAVFTYQGQLKEGGLPANGTYDLLLRLFDGPTLGHEIGSGVSVDDLVIINGLFTVELDFGAGAFTGDARWLEIAARPGASVETHTVLVGRQPLTAAPYALYAFDSPASAGYWRANANEIYNVNTGNVGIGTSSPGRKLQIGNTATPNSEGMIRLASRSGTQGSNRIWDIGVPETDADSSRFGYSFVIDDTQLGIDPEFMVKWGSGNVGIGTSAPATKLHVDGGTDASPTGGGYFVIGSVGGANLALDNNEIMARNDGVASPLFLNASGGNVLLSNASGRVGIGTSTPQEALDVLGKARIGLTDSNSGFVGTYGLTGNLQAAFTSLAGYPNNGYVGVKYGADWAAGMYVAPNGTGVIYADLKQFRMANPNEPGTEIRYACLEGPEAAAYLRGTGHLVDGRAEIKFPDHFVAVASSVGMTMQLTPLSGDSKGLAVVEKRADGFVVTELLGGKGAYGFDYNVMAVRKGHEDYKVIQLKAEEMPAVPETK
jgi:hypothetical protein